MRWRKRKCRRRLGVARYGIRQEGIGQCQTSWPAGALDARLEPGGDLRPARIGDVAVLGDVKRLAQLVMDGGVGHAGQLVQALDAGLDGMLMFGRECLYHLED